MSNPKVTIITVTYNAEQYLEQTIKSVIEQDYPNVEYIIIDGASSDRTIDIIKQYEEHITYWKSEPDTGIYDAMNKSIDVATGEWINFMNAGDSFCGKNTISQTLSFGLKDCDLICGDIYYGDHKIYKAAYGLDYKFQHMFCFHQASFVKTSIMKKYKYDTSFTIAGDYDFFLKCAINEYNFKFINHPIANFLADGISETNILKAKIEDLFIQSKYVKEFEKLSSSYALAKLYQIYQQNNNHNLEFSILFNRFQISLKNLNLHGKQFILYGFGTIGKLIYEEYKDSIICIVDKDFENINKQHDISILNPEILTSYESEYILIAILGREKLIQNLLNSKYNISKKQILEIEIH